MREFPETPKTRSGFSLRARLKSFVYAGRGLRWLIQDEHNARVHLAASVIVVSIGLFLRISLADWRWLILAIALVWLAEAFNTTIEELCDRISPEFDIAIGRIKDLAAGGVLVASIAAMLIGAVTLLPPLLARLH
jgi:diacylglycerol kinase (ATP)